MIERTFVLRKAEEQVYLGENLEFVVVNAGGFGFYRVEYSEALRGKLMDNLSQLSASERFNLVADLWANVLAGKLDAKSYIPTVGVLSCTFGELDVNVWTTILGSLSYMRRMLSDIEEVQSAFLNLARSLLLPPLNRLGWQPKAGESAQHAQLRGSLVRMLGVLGDSSVRERCAALFQSYISGSAEVETNLLPAVIDTVAAWGDEAVYNDFSARSKNSATPQEQQRFLYALMLFRQPELHARTLAACLDKTIRTQDAPYVVQLGFFNPRHSRATWEFVKANWDAMSAAYPVSGMTRMCEGVTALVDPALEAEIRQFLAEHPVKGGEKQIAQFLELLTIAVRFRERNKGALEDLLLLGYQEGVDF